MRNGIRGHLQDESSWGATFRGIQNQESGQFQTPSFVSRGPTHRRVESRMGAGVAEAPAPPKLRTNVGQTLSSVNPVVPASFFRVRNRLPASGTWGAPG